MEGSRQVLKFGGTSVGSGLGRRSFSTTLD
jgi:aspartokinase